MRRTPLAGVLVASPANPTGTMMTPRRVARGDRGRGRLGIRFISDEIYHGLDYAFAAETARGLSRRRHRHQFVFQVFLHDRLAGRLDGGAGALVRPVEPLQQNLAISAPTLSQIAAACRLRGTRGYGRDQHGYEANRRILLDGLPSRLRRTSPGRRRILRLCLRVAASPTIQPSSPSACWPKPAWPRRPAPISTPYVARTASGSATPAPPPKCTKRSSRW